MSVSVESCTHLRDGNQVFRVDGQKAELLDGQVKRTDGDTRHMLRPDLHLRKKAIDEVDGSEEDVIWQVVPDFEAAKYVRGTITSANRYFTIL